MRFGYKLFIILSTMELITKVVSVKIPFMVELPFLLITIIAVVYAVFNDLDNWLLGGCPTDKNYKSNLYDEKFHYTNK